MGLFDPPTPPPPKSWDQMLWSAVFGLLALVIVLQIAASVLARIWLWLLLLIVVASLVAASRASADWRRADRRRYW